MSNGSRFSRSREQRQKMVAQNLETKGKKGGVISSETWCPDKEGAYTFDVIPYLITKQGHPDFTEESYNVGEEYFFRRGYSLHWIDRKPYVCPKETFGMKCPICEARAKLEYGSDEEKLLRTKRNVLYVTRMKGESEYKILDWGYSKFTKPLEEHLELTDDREELAFYEFEGGMTITMKVKNNIEKPNMHYLEAKAFKFVDRADLDEDIIDTVPKLDDLIKVLPYEKLLAIFKGSAETLNEVGENEVVEEVQKTVQKPVQKKESVVSKKPEKVVDVLPVRDPDDFEDATSNDDDDWGSETPEEDDGF